MISSSIRVSIPRKFLPRRSVNAFGKGGTQTRGICICITRQETASVAPTMTRSYRAHMQCAVSWDPHQCPRVITEALASNLLVRAVQPSALGICVSTILRKRPGSRSAARMVRKRRALRGGAQRHPTFLRFGNASAPNGYHQVQNPYLHRSGINVSRQTSQPLGALRKGRFPKSAGCCPGNKLHGQKLQTYAQPRRQSHGG